MSERANVSRKGWRDLKEFAAVDLTHAYVLSWQYDGRTLLLDADVKLLPEHAAYERPRPAEKVCVRPVKIEFPYCENVTIQRPGSDRTQEVAVSELPGGKLSDLVMERDGVYAIQGPFGTVKFDAGRPVLRLGH